MNKEELLQKARERADSYRPNNTILEQFGSKTFIALVGPAGVGKSTTGDTLMRIDPDFGRTGSVVTRQPEARDNPAFYRYLSLAQAVDRIEKREFVNYIVHPTTEAIYATDPDMYDHPYTILETLPGAVEYFRRLGFKAMHTLYLVSGGSQWQQWFDERYLEHGPERTKRLKEAKVSLEWSLSDEVDDITFIYNPPGQQETTAQTIIDLVKYNQYPEDAKKHAEEMLAKVKEMK